MEPTPALPWLQPIRLECTVDALNLLRAVLVGCALIATIILATRGQWVPVTVLSIGIAAHLALFIRQLVVRRADATL